MKPHCLWDLETKIQWNFNQNAMVYSREETVENVICEIAVILSWPQYNKELIFYMYWQRRNWCNFKQYFVYITSSDIKLKYNVMVLIEKNPYLTKWCICASVDYTIISSDNGLSSIWRQAIIWTNDDILSIRPYGTHVNEVLVEIRSFSFKKTHLKVASAKWRPFFLGFNV